VAWTSALTNIGTGSVVGSGAMSQAIVWNDTFPGTATGTINGIAIKAKVQPTLNMIISGTGTIDLGDLTSASYNTGSVNIEIGTNAVNGAAVTAKSTNGWLRNGTGSDYINSLSTDGAIDSYLFTSTLGAITDSSFTGTINQVFMSSTEVNNSTTSHPIYGSSRPQQTNWINDILFSVSAKPNSQSPAGNYSDIVIITITGTF
jgi:hypothetical protein